MKIFNFRKPNLFVAHSTCLFESVISNEGLVYILHSFIGLFPLLCIFANLTDYNLVIEIHFSTNCREIKP